MTDPRFTAHCAEDADVPFCYIRDALLGDDAGDLLQVSSVTDATYAAMEALAEALNADPQAYPVTLSNLTRLMVEAGVPIDSHNSDLYCKVTPESRALIQRYESRTNVQTFREQIKGEMWYDVPFAFDEAFADRREPRV